MCLIPHNTPSPHYEGWEAMTHMTWLIKIADKWNTQLFMYIDEHTEILAEQTYIKWCEESKNIFENLKIFKKMVSYFEKNYKYMMKMIKEKQLSEEKAQVAKQRIFNNVVAREMEKIWGELPCRGLTSWDNDIFMELDDLFDKIEYYNGYMKCCIQNPGHIISGGGDDDGVWIIKDKETDKMINNPLIHLNYLVQ